MLDPAGLIERAGPWAYAALFLVVFADGVPVLGAVAPGYWALVAAGVAAAVGDLSVAAVLAVGFAAALAGDVVAFEAGRRWGARVVARLPARAHGAAARVQAALSRHLGEALVLGRFSAVVRHLAAPVAGSSGVPRRRFLGWAAAGTGLWALRASATGFLAATGLAGGASGPLALVAVAVAASALLAPRWYRSLSSSPATALP